MGKKCVRGAVAAMALGGAMVGGAQSAAAQVAYAGYAKNIAPGAFNQPSGVAVDSAGDVFVANNGTSGVYEVPAGCTTQACVVSLGGGWSSPEAVAVDSSGNIYVADLDLHAVEKLNASCTSGACMTAVGGYFGQPTGVAVDKYGNIYVADQNTYVISELAPTCTSSSCVTNLGGGHYSYSSVVVDASGNIYGTDYTNSVVRKMTPGCTGQSCTSTVYTGASGGQLDGIALDSSNNLYVTDKRLGTAAKIPVGCATTACAVSLGTWYNHPLQPAVDGNGNVYIPDSYAAEVREVENIGTPNFASANVGSTVSDLYTVFFTFSGTTTLNSTTPTEFVTTGVAVNDFIADTNLTYGSCGYRGTFTYAAGTSCYVNVNFAPVAPGVRLGAAELLNSSGTVIATTLISGIGSGPLTTYTPGTISTVVGNGQAGYSAGPSSATSGPMNLNGSYGMAVDAAGNLYIAESINGVVHKVTASTGVITTVAGSGQGINGTICSTATDGYGNGCPATSANMVPYSVALDGAGNLYIMDYYAAEIRKVDAATGVITAFASTGVQNNGGIAVDSNNNVYFADDYDSEIREVLASNGNIVTLAGTGTAGYSGDGGAATNAQINSPLCLTLDSQNNIYFADLGNGAVRKISNGIITTVAGGPNNNPYYSGGNVLATSVRLEYPGGLAVDPAGNVYIADFGLDYVMKVSASTGILSTIANYTEQFEGPQATGIDGSGNLYVVDGYANVVFEITATPAALSFATTALGATSSDSPQTVTVNNIGNTLLTFSTPATGTNPSIASGFSIGGSSTCPQLSTSSSGTLASGTSCTDLISFSPTVAGNVSGQLVTTDNSHNVTGSTQTVSLSGTGTYPTPTVTGLSPSSGSTAGGNTVTITGTGFTGATTVKFGTVGATSFTVGSGGTSITAVAPAHSAGSAYVTVSNPNSISASSVQYTYVAPAPTVTSISPSYGAAAGGGTITITGTGFITGATVKFGGASATSVSVISSTSITAKSPSGTAGSTVDVTVKTSSGTSATSSADQYTYQGTQTITFAGPTSPVTYGVSPITLSATASSGLPVTFSITSGGAYGTLSGTNNSVLTITGVGSITIAANQAGNSSYAAATAVSRMLVVNQATQTISFTQPTTPVAYGVSPITLLATGGSSGNPVTFSITSGGAYGTLSGTNNSVLTVTGVGTIVIAANQAGNANYTAATQVTKTLVVNQATQNINFTAPASPVTYGVSPITLVATGGASGNPVTFSITSGSAYGSLSGTNNSVLKITGAGTITIAANQAGSTNYAAATQVTQTVIVNKATLTAAIIGTPTKTYNGTTAATLTSANYQLTGLVGTDSFTVTQTAGTYAAATAGTQTVTATLSPSNFTTVSGSLSNYTLPTSASGSGTISPANASVTPNVATKVYGTADPTLTGVLTGFVASDNVTATYSRVTGSNVGSYTITATLSPAAVLANYNITYNTAQFSITPAPATVTANPASKTYGAANPAFTATVGGTVNGDTLNYTLTTTATTASGVGPYPITVTLGSNPNYTVTPTNGTLTVGQATATVTANAASKTYGAANPAFTATVGGTVNGDTLNYTLTTTATTASGVGPYPITVNLGTNPNYTVTATNGTLTVNQATATVTANPASKTYGAANPTFTATVGGTVNGDTLNYTLTTTATTNSGVGPYPITVNLGANPNYTVTPTNGTLTVNQALASVTPNAATKVYGTSDPALSGTLKGFLPSDNVVASYSRSAGATVGSYTISAALSPTAVLSNYNITYNTAAFTITQASASVTPNAAAKVFGTADPTLTGTLSGFVPLDNITAIYSRVAGENVGSYTINAALSPSAVLANYNIINNTALFSITPAMKIITFPQPATPVATNSTATLTATASNGDPVTYTVTSGTATISGSTITFTNAGSVTIAADSAATANYLAAATVSDIVVVNPAASAYSAPTTAVGVASGTQTAYVNFTAAGTLGTISVVTQGATGLDYNAATGGTCAVGMSYTAGQVCSVTYTFTPTSPGQRNGAIVLLDNNGNPLGTSYLGGTGTAPLGLFTSTQQTLNLGGFNIPRGLSTDGFGNVYVLDTGNNNVDVIPVGTNAATVIATIPNTGSSGATAVDGAGNLFVNDGGAQTIYEFVGAKPPAIAVASTCGSDDNLWIDGAGNLYYSCYSSDAGGIEKVSAGTYVTTELFPGNQGYRFVALTVDGAGDVFAPDFNSNTLFELSAGSTTLTPLVSNDGNLSNPHGIALDLAGNIYVTNYSGSQNVMRYAAGSYAFTQLPAAGSRGVVIDGSGNLYTIPDDGTIAGYSRTVAPPLTFADTAVGMTSNSQQTVEYENDGNAPLTISSYSATSPFALTGAGNTCIVGSLASGSTCFVGAVFSPQVAGAQTGTATLTSNSNNATGLQQTLVLSGNGLPGAQTISFGPLAPVIYGVTPITLSATGGPSGNPVTFTVVRGSATVSGNVLTITGAGDVVIAADQAGNTNYLTAPTVYRHVFVNKAELTASITGNPTKTYDSTTTATLTATDYTLSGLVNGDNFTVTQTAGTYAAANVGSENVTATLSASSLTPISGSLSNYTLSTSASGAGTITAATLTASIIGNPTKTYNGTTVATLTSSNYQLTGLAGTDSFIMTQTVGTYAAAAAGTESVTATLSSSSFTAISGSLSNYTLPTSATGPGTITQAAASVTPNTTSKTYGTADPAFTGTLTGFLPADAVTATYSRTAGETVGGSPYSISATLSPTSVLANYNITYTTAAFTITPATATVVANPASKIYGTANPTLSATVAGTVNGDTLNYTLATTATTTSGVGPYSINVTLGLNPNYSVTPTNGTLTVGQATATVMANAASKIYGTANPTLSATVAGTVNGDTLNYTLATTATTASGVGPYPINVTLGLNPNYSVTPTNGTLTVNQATATVTANPASKTYGATNPTLSATVSGTVNGDTLNYTLTTTATIASGVGSYPITVTLSNNPNYTVTPTNGTLTVGQATATVTANAASKTYGAANPAFTTTVGGTVNGDMLNYALATTATTASGVGPYPITVTLGSNPNYSVTPTNGTLTVNQATATVVANPASKTYGAANPAFTATVNGTVNGDTLSYTLTTTATTASGVGPYPITVNLGNNPNYTVTPTNGTLTVGQALASVTPNAATKVYGTADPTFTGTLTGFLASDNVVAAYSRTAGTSVGSYTISAMLSPTAVLANYSITYKTASFSITKANASVTPNVATKVYGTADPTFTGSLSGFLPAEGVTATYSRTSGETVGGSPYTISATLNPTAVLANYNITYNTAGFTITQATPTITWATPVAITYGTALSGAQLNATASIPGTLAYTPAAGTVLGAGTQTLNVSFTPNDTTDFTSVSAQVTLTVNQATPIVTWTNPPSVVYGTATGIAQQTATANVPGSFFYTQPNGVVLKAGTYPLGVAFTPTDTTDYAPVSAYAYLTVTPATPTVTWANPPSIVYGTGTGAAQKTATATGVGGVSLPGSYFYTTPDGTVFTVGTHPLGVAFTPTDSTDYVAVSAYAYITVTKAIPTVIWSAPAAITYGMALSATQLDATASVPGSFSYSPAAGTVLNSGAQTLSVTFTPNDTTDYSPFTTTVPLTVNKATTTATIAVTTTQTVTGTTATITATVHPQVGGAPTGTVTYYNGSTALGSAAVGTPFTTGVLPVGTDQIAAVYSGDSNFVGSSSSATAVTSLAPTTVQLTSPLGTVFYPASAVSFTVIVPLKNFQLISGTVTLYDGSTVIGTYSLPAGGVLTGVTQQLSVGTHTLRAVYSGNGQYPPGQSAIVTVTVAAL